MAVLQKIAPSNFDSQFLSISLQSTFSTYLAPNQLAQNTLTNSFSFGLDKDEQEHLIEAKSVLIDIKHSLDMTPDPLALDLLNTVYSISLLTKTIKKGDEKSISAIKLQLKELKSQIREEIEAGEQDTQYLEEELSALQLQLYQKDHLNLSRTVRRTTKTL